MGMNLKFAELLDGESRSEFWKFIQALADNRISKWSADAITGEDKAKDFICKNYDDIQRYRGKIQGIQEFIDTIKGEINQAKRMVKEAKDQQDKQN